MQHLLKSGTVGAADGARTSTKDSSATVRIKPNEICCYRLEARLLADCSGGNSRLSYLLRCGGRSFFDQKVQTDTEPHYGIESTVRFPDLVTGDRGALDRGWGGLGVERCAPGY